MHLSRESLCIHTYMYIYIYISHQSGLATITSHDMCKTSQLSLPLKDKELEMYIYRALQNTALLFLLTHQKCNNSIRQTSVLLNAYRTLYCLQYRAVLFCTFNLPKITKTFTLQNLPTLVLLKG